MGGKKRTPHPISDRTEEVLASILEGGKVDVCIHFFRGSTEKERSTLSPMCKTLYSRVRKNYWIKTSGKSMQRNPLAAVSEAAFLCTASYSSLKKCARHTLPDGDVAFEILRDRNPPWLGQWAEHLVSGERHWLVWRLVRRLIRELGVARPEHPHYYLGMISGINRYDYSQSRTSTVIERLKEDPDLLEHEVWKLFEHEGSGENSLANSDRFGDDGWSKALLLLVEEGRLSREGLRISCLKALRSDFNHYRAKWFATFFDLLEIPTEIQDAHWPVFLELLGVSAPNIVSWAFKKVTIGYTNKSYGTMALAEALRPVLLARGKGLVKRALKMLLQIATTDAKCAHQVCRLAVSALAHEAADVQAAAMKVIEAHGDPNDTELVSEIEAYRGLVAATLQTRLVAWIGSEEETHPAVSEDPLDLESCDIPEEISKAYRLPSLQDLGHCPTCIPSAKLSDTNLPRLAILEPVTPIETAEELVSVCAQVLEDSASIDDVERALDGLSRLCAARESVDLAPLRKRAKQRLHTGLVPFAGLGPAHEMVGLILAWTSSELAGITFGKNQHGHNRIVVEIESTTHEYWSENTGKVLGFLSRRSYALSRRLATRAASPLLSAPTHSGCWIDPIVLASRVMAWTGSPPDETEVVLALLRMAPDGRKQAASMLTSIDQQWQHAIAYAMGKDVEIGRSSTLWVTAARSRAPFTEDPKITARFPEVLADGGLPATYEYIIARDNSNNPVVRFSPELTPGRVEENCVPSILISQRDNDGAYMWELGGIGGTTEQSVRWVQSVWPLARESLFAASAVQLGKNLDWWGAEWQNKAFLEPLLDPGTPLRQMGALLLALGLGAKEPGEHLLATDIVIAAIEDGRVGSDNFGAVCTKLLPSGFIKPGRWAKTLAEVARASSGHALVVKLILEQCLEGEIGDKGRDFAKLLGLLHELSAELSYGIASNSARSFLAALRGTNKAAKVARVLLELDTHSGPILRRACNQLLSFRVQAARQWTSGGPISPRSTL